MRSASSYALMSIITLVLAAGLAAAESSAGPAQQAELSFERLNEDWVGSPLDDNTGQLSRIASTTGPHAGAIKIPGKTPKSIGVTYYPWRDWTAYTTLSFDVFFPPEVPKTAEVQVYLKDHQYWWFQTYPLHDPVTAKRARDIKPGQWERYSLDVSEDSAIWEPGGHKRSWDRALYMPREFGIRIFCDKAWEGWVLLDQVRLSGHEPPLGKRATTGEPPTSFGLKLDVSARELPVYEKLEITFNLDRDYLNPFDPEVVDVSGRFLLPDGRELEVPGFYYQDYERSLAVVKTKDEEGREKTEEREKLIPVGAPCWKVRFSPVMEGEHRFYVSVRDTKGELRSEGHTFTAHPPTDPRGLVRVSKRNPMYFEFDNGEWFVPNGINMRDGGDHAERQKGTYAFDYFFRRFQQEGLNFVRTWMCAWWAGIEWDEDYHSRYDGVGRYAFYNAWRLDYLFDLADRHDLFIELTLNSHGQLRRDKYDAEWRYNPYAARNGGYVASPSMLFTNERVREDFKRRYRYIVARWGYSQHLMSYDLWNEIDLAEGPNAAEVAAWHQEMGAYLKSIDPWKHLVCTHVCLYGGFGDALWALPEIEYIQADAYWQPWEKKLNEFFDRRAQYRNKPMFFIEYGPQTADLPVPYAIWQREWRVVGWTGNMMPMAAPPQFWYHNEWDDLKLYRLQQAMAAFNAGIDRPDLDLHKMAAVTTSPKEVFVQAMAGGDRAFFYVYHWENMSYEAPDQVPAAKRVKNASVMLIRLPQGKYELDYWDTVAGQVIATEEIEVAGSRALINLPEFAQDLACKLKRDEG